jgi:hypothetical protein
MKVKLTKARRLAKQQEESARDLEERMARTIEDLAKE